MKLRPPHISNFIGLNKPYTTEELSAAYQSYGYAWRAYEDEEFNDDPLPSPSEPLLDPPQRRFWVEEGVQWLLTPEGQGYASKSFILFAGILIGHFW